MLPPVNGLRQHECKNAQFTELLTGNAGIICKDKILFL